MALKYLPLLAGLLIPATSFAQAGMDGEKAAGLIECELNAACTATDPAAPEPSADTAIAAAPVATRGWSWSNRDKAAPVATPRQPSANVARTKAASATAGRSQVRRGNPGLTRLAIGFAPGGDQLTDGGRRQADQLFRAIGTASLAGSRYLIAGHTEASGAADANLDLSRRRAQVLVDYLVAKGVPREQFRVRGYGSGRPLPGVSPGSQANRRVEVVKLD